MKNRKLYLVERKGEVGYDELCGAVIIADSKKDARAMASTRAGDEGKSIWFSKKVKVSVIGSHRSKPRIILRDFNAG